MGKFEEQDLLQNLIACVEAVARSRGIKDTEIGRYWDWLGNVKFKEDNGDLTLGRASQLVADNPYLVEEFREWQKTAS